MQEMNHGRGHPLGTCVLLEVPSIQSLVEYFRAILSIAYNFELKGIEISTYEITTANSVRAERNCSCKLCCSPLCELLTSKRDREHHHPLFSRNALVTS